MEQSPAFSECSESRKINYSIFPTEIIKFTQQRYNEFTSTRNPHQYKTTWIRISVFVTWPPVDKASS
jgi:hypothetical protein